ncbi:MAG: hypothetical protein FD174_1697 [Geobacteraceae bacterium]|nr:MAG: hypothetical protein FD174_1697 [Geobacteraceae bacterium]
MKNVTVMPFVQNVVRNHPALVTVATAASGFIRQMTIKPFTPRKRRREFLLKDRVTSLHAVRNQIFKEKGAGDIPTIIIAGFVPDATEVTEFQRPLLRNYGSIYYMNYPRNGFSIGMFFAQLADLIEDINRRGKKPVLFGISFGCGLIAQFLRETAVNDRLDIRGVVMASPVLCTEDLVRPEGEKTGGVRMLESNLRRILKAHAENGQDVNRQIERARRCFLSLFEAGAENRVLTSRHLSIRKKIMEVVEKTSAVGGYQRVLALKDFPSPTGNAPIFSGPALALLAEMEENLLVSASPTLAALKNPDIRTALFPRGKVKHVISPVKNDAVVHASLIFHHHCYNPLIEAWYDKLRQPALFAVV